MSYLQTVQDKRVVNKDEQNHKALLAAIDDLKKSLVIKTSGHESGEVVKALETKLLPVLQRIQQALKPADHSDLLKAIKDIELAPVINVPEPKVLVENQPIDLAPLQDAIRESFVTDSTPDKYDLSRYKAQDLKDDGDKQYIGFMNPEGCWYIIENDVSGNTMRYIFGDKAYTTRFKNAAGYKYQLLNKAIHAKA